MQPGHVHTVSITNVQLEPLGGRNPDDYGRIRAVSLPVLWDPQSRSGVQEAGPLPIQASANVLPTPTSRGQIRKQRRMNCFADDLRALPAHANPLDLSLEDMGLSLLGDEIETTVGQVQPKGCTSPRSLLLAELLADTPRSSLLGLLPPKKLDGLRVSEEQRLADRRMALLEASPLSPASMGKFSSQLMDSVQSNHNQTMSGVHGQSRSVMDKVMQKQREDEWQESANLLRQNSLSDLDLSLEDMGLSLLGEDIELGRVCPSHGTISPRSQLLAELMADTPKSSAHISAFKKTEPQQQGYVLAQVEEAPPSAAPMQSLSNDVTANTANNINTCTLLNVSKPDALAANPKSAPAAIKTKPKHKPKQLKSAPAAAEENGIVNPVAAEHLNPRLRVICDDKKAANPSGANQTQMLWHKYGEKTVRNRKAGSGRPNALLQRAYFKCFKRECSAKLTVDLDLDTRELVKASSSGAHNHFFEVAAEELGDI